MNELNSRHVDVERVRTQARNRFNPLRNLTPAIMAQRLESYEAGYLREGGLLFDAILKRDLIVRAVAPKKFGAPVARGYEVKPVKGADGPELAAEVKRQTEAVEFALEHCTCRRADDLDYCEDFGGLIETMMLASAYGHSAHEIVWSPLGDGLTFEALHVPIWFFERRDGYLKFLESDYATEGVDINREEWLVTTMEPLMLATAVAYQLKSLPIRDWLNYTEKFGLPYLLGQSDARPGSAEWNALHDALRDFMSDGAAVTTRGAIDIVQAGGGQGGEATFRGLIEMMDKYIAAIWRGGDMSTISAETSHVYGVSAQAGEGDLLEAADCRKLTTTLNKQLVPQILRYALGVERPLVRVYIGTPEGIDATAEMAIDSGLSALGVRLSESELRERYHRNAPDGEDDAVNPMAAAPAGPQESIETSGRPALATPAAAGGPNQFRGLSIDQFRGSNLANQKALSTGDEKFLAELTENAVSAAMDVRPVWLKPLRERLLALIAKAQDDTLTDDDFRAIAAEAHAQIPELLGELDIDALAASFEAALGSAVAYAAIEEDRRQKSSSTTTTQTA